VKFLSRKKALERLSELKTAYQSHIKNNYEHKAKNCLTCEVQGVCCTDAHFVNVHITRLEAAAIQVYKRVAETIEKYHLTSDGDTFKQTFACPLFETGTGCLVHSVKPVPCIQHACYDRREDLPPDDLQMAAEHKIEKLNQQTYGNSKWRPLPIYLQQS
jgi:hypothetical protein